MTINTNNSPPLDAIEAALNETTELLARQLCCPSDAAPRWSDFEWRVAQAAATLQGISALLSQRLPWKGPDHWEAFLTEQRTHGVLRHRRIMQLLAEIDCRARSAGVAAVALKGAALHDLGIYQPGERPMGDVDLLVRAEDAQACAPVLAELGYEQAFMTWRHRVFEPLGAQGFAGFGEHVDNPVKIEIHDQIIERLPIRDTDITKALWPQSPRPGLNRYPSLASLMRHLLLHAAGNMRARALRLIQLHDVALLAARMRSDDWEELLQHSTGNAALWWALPPLMLTARYYPAAIPAKVMSAIQPGCPWLLRQVSRHHRLIDVSWAKIRIQAFPGIEWSSSLAEAARFVASRAFPSRSALSELEQLAATQLWAARIPWYGQSHATRILRWVFASPPRVQTIFSVRLALGWKP